MGYDNNTPLSGVTGGGLPAEIWHETMVRVLDGMTPVPLPMDEPVEPGPILFGPQPGGASDGNFLIDLLNSILGGGN